MKHICKICGYSTNRISNFKDHQNRKKPCVSKIIIQECDIEKNFNENDEKYKKDNGNFNDNVQNIEDNVQKFNETDQELDINGVDIKNNKKFI